MPEASKKTFAARESVRTYPLHPSPPTGLLLMDCALSVVEYSEGC